MGFALPAPAQDRPVEVKLEFSDDGFVAELQLPRDAPVWAFSLSDLAWQTGKSWRAGHWQVLTEGIRFERIGIYDALVSDSASVPRLVRLAAPPFFGELSGGYDQALQFSNGAVAVYGGHFRIFPMESREDLAVLDWPYVEELAIAHSAPGGEVRLGTERGETVYGDGDLYAVFGEAQTVRGEDYSAVLDAGMPSWLGQDIAVYLPQVFEQYTARLGPHAQKRPTAYAIWLGTASRYLRGTVTANIMVLRFSGEDLLEANPESKTEARHLVAHEAAHFWLGQTIRHERAGDLWMTESGAELLALRLTGAIDPDHARQAPTLATLRMPCAATLQGPSLDTAGFSRVCGLLLLLLVEKAGAQHGRDFFDFVATLVARGDDRISPAEWLDAARDFGVSEAHVAIMRRMIVGEMDDGEDALAALLD